MSDTSKTAILALGVSRLFDLEQKKRQRDRARKVSSYLKMTKAIKSDLFKSQLKMDASSLFKLLGLVRPHIEALKVDLEECTVEERLLVTLKYLATGCSFNQLTDGSIKTSLLTRVIPETCKALFKCLRDYIKLPKTEKEWEDIALSFENKWQFSHCAGALAAKHIAIDEPPDDPDKFINHKKYHSVVLVAVVNADYEFTYINTGCNGGYKYIYVSTEFFEMLTEDQLGLPKDCPLMGTDYPMPYVFVGETDFLIENIMKPYLEEITPERKVFNYRLLRAKRVADNAFGLLYERFGIFHQNISIAEDDLNCVVMACCALHNFLIKCSKEYVNEKSLDVEDLMNNQFKPASWRLKKEDGRSWGNTHPLHSLLKEPETISDSRGGMIREKFTDYFNNEGKVPFQDEMVNVVPE